MKSLIELVQTANQIEEQILENNGELDEHLEVLLDLTSTELASKVDNYNFFIEKLAANEAYWKAKAKEYSDYAAKFANAQSKIKEHLKAVMLQNEMKEIVGNEIRYTLRPSAGSLVIEDESKIPNEFLVIKTEVNKADLKKAIAAGKEVAGAKIEQGYTLSKYSKKIN